uniref:MIF4G domain-containing protein n=1 Tax=Strigamia maritima TaxID=126957 RepID=T1J0P9_STRMM
MDSMIPRGRGRGRKIVGEGVGRSNIEAPSSVNDVIDKIDILLLDGGDNVEVENVYKISEAVIKSQEDMEFVVAAICNSCFSNEAFINIGCKVCCSLWPIKTDYAKFRSSLLIFLENEYKNREKTYKSSPDRFLNVVKFFAQLSVDLRPICTFSSDILLKVQLDYLLMLLESDNEVHTSLMEKLLRQHGPALKLQNATFFDNLLLKLRQKIVDEATGTTRRVTLLLLFEMCILDFKGLSDNIKLFYQQKLIQ